MNVLNIAIAANCSAWIGCSQILMLRGREHMNAPCFKHPRNLFRRFGGIENVLKYVLSDEDVEGGVGKCKAFQVLTAYAVLTLSGTYG